MNRLITIIAATLLCGSISAQDMIGKNNIKLQSDLMTPEALWAMGRIGSYEASPDGKKIVYQVAYYSVEQNKSHQMLYITDVKGKKNIQLTTTADNETDPTWLDKNTIAFARGGEI